MYLQCSHKSTSSRVFVVVAGITCIFHKYHHWQAISTQQLRTMTFHNNFIFLGRLDGFLFSPDGYFEPSFTSPLLPPFPWPPVLLLPLLVNFHLGQCLPMNLPGIIDFSTSLTFTLKICWLHQRST